MLENDEISPFDSTTAWVEHISDFLDWMQVFLATHPIAIWIRNYVSVLLWEGGTIGFTHPFASIEEMFEDILSL